MEDTRGKGKILIDGHFMPFSRLAKVVGDDDYGKKYHQRMMVDSMIHGCSEFRIVAKCCYPKFCRTSCDHFVKFCNFSSI